MRISAGSRGLSRNGGNIHVHPEIPLITIRPRIKRHIGQSIPRAPLEIRDASFQELIRISPASNYMEELVAGPGGLLSRGLLEDDATRNGALPRIRLCDSWFAGSAGFQRTHIKAGHRRIGLYYPVVHISERQIIVSDRKRVLILCTGNSARSQMAEGLLRHDAGDQFDVVSAGVEPTKVRPLAIAAMQEAGIDISGQRSKSVDEFAGQEFDYVITVCDNANQQCPTFPGKTRRIHWSIEDPAAAAGNEEERLNVFRRIRDELRDRLREFVATGSR